MSTTQSSKIIHKNHHLTKGISKFKSRPLSPVSPKTTLTDVAWYLHHPLKTLNLIDRTLLKRLPLKLLTKSLLLFLSKSSNCCKPYPRRLQIFSNKKQPKASVGSSQNKLVVRNTKPSPKSFRVSHCNWDFADK